MGELVLKLTHKINNSDYTDWSKQMDIFAKNLMNYTHWANFKNISHRPSTQAPAPVLTLTLTLAAIKKPIDLNKISDTERKHYFNNRLYLIYGLPSHWKDAYNPIITANLIPIPAH